MYKVSRSAAVCFFVYLSFFKYIHFSCAGKETVRKIMQPVRIKIESLARIRKWNQFSYFTSTAAKLIPVEKT